MDRLELEVSVREAGNKGHARRLRASGAVPAVVYGSGSETVPLSVDEPKLAAVLRRGTNQIIDLKGPDGFKDRLVLLKETQLDPVTDRILHCDFFTVDTKQTIDVAVPVHVEGRAHGVEMGGILELVLREIEVKCLPLAIPERLDIDVSNLDVGDALHVSDLVFPDDVEVITDLGLTLVHVVAPRVEEEPTEEDEEGEVLAEGEAVAEGEAEAAPSEAAPKPEEGSGD
jgi:large subunit ribosomal protein L25